MNKVTLHIESAGERREIALEDELSVGRTDLARVVLPDAGLSRLNSTFFRDGEDVFVADESSLNGTFVNGEKIVGRPRLLTNGDQVTLGNNTRIRVEIAGSDFDSHASNNRFANSPQSSNYKSPETLAENTFQPPAASGFQNQPSEIQNPKSDQPPLILIAAVLSTFVIIFLALIGYLVASRYENEANKTNGKPSPTIQSTAVIPVRVIDTLGFEEDEELEELIASWTVEIDEDFKQEDLQPVEVSTDAPQLAVTAEYWAKQKAKAMEPRSGQGAISNVTIPDELKGNIGTQLSFMARTGITREKLPRDFVSLAQMRLNNELVELPLATETYYLDNIGTSANESPFNFFDPATKDKRVLMPNEEGFSFLQRLAANYSGEKYDLNNPKDRIKIKRRLLRMFHPKAKIVLEEVAGAYFKQFNRPLKVTSLTRSLEYQNDLSKATSNAYKGPTPPHSTGLTFDIAYMHMTAEEQNFIMKKFAELERANRVDSFHERGQTPCIHTFVYP